METNTNIHKRHTLYISDSGTTLTGVIGVQSYDEKELVVVLSQGGVTLWGENFKIEKLDVDSGTLEVSGRLISLKYGGVKEKQGIMKRLVK